MTYVTLEALSFVAYPLGTAEVFSFAALRQRRSALVGEATQVDALVGDARRGGWTFEDIILHPYLGYSSDPLPFSDRSAGLATGLQGAPVPDQGITIAVTGGSVAEGFFAHIRNNKRWLSSLRSIPELGDQAIHHVFLGLRGYKQPQQLLGIAYYLSLGGKLDVLINLDGYNEVGLSGDLYQVGVFPAYPYHWRALTQENVTPARLKAAGRIVLLQDRRRRAAAICEHFRLSVSANVLWHFLDHHLAVRLQSLQSSIEVDQPGHEYPYSRTGPRAAVPESELYPWLADVWSRSSSEIHSLASAHGFHYLHFLQPNQYVPGSKPLSNLEKANAYDVGSRHYRHVKGGYPELLARGEQLRARGVSFHDLTQVFRDVSDTIYTDKCCHFNRKGNRLIASAIAREIESLLAAQRDS